MASKAMWEVDPETRSKLITIQKEPGNNLCCDCNAPSPQWASPKFGIFICLSCAGVHRGLGVHISFVRSISMDAFKAVEIERMRLGGNAGWRAFFEAHADTKMRGLTWDDATIAERYGSEAGEEWKERLSAKVEGREYVPVPAEKKPKPAAVAAVAAATATAAGSAPGSQTGSRNASRSATPLAGMGMNNNTSRTASPSRKVKVDDKYFARLGADNASRPDDLPPSQGGKYGGFGSAPMPTKRPEQALPNMDELQKDPVAALSKGFGWFTSAVSKTAKSVNDDYIQPTAKQLAESDIAAQARSTAAHVARSAQIGVKSAQDGFSRFVEGQDGPDRRRQVPIDESKKDFWDDFSSLADQKKAEPSSSSIGTSAMGKGGAGRPAGPGKPAQKDEWEEW